MCSVTAVLHGQYLFPAGKYTNLKANNKSSQVDDDEEVKYSHGGLHKISIII